MNKYIFAESEFVSKKKAVLIFFCVTKLFVMCHFSLIGQTSFDVSPQMCTLRLMSESLKRLKISIDSIQCLSVSGHLLVQNDTTGGKTKIRVRIQAEKHVLAHVY